jgi:outer membrane protein assembly factor BamB
MDTEGRQRWRRHPDDRNPTDAKTWAVAFSLDGSTLFIGSSGAARHVLAALDATNGTRKTALRPDGRVMAMAPLPPPLGVLAQLSEPDGSRLVAYPADLQHTAWEFGTKMSGRITAIATDAISGLAALGTTMGHLALLDAETGRLLAENKTLGSTVLSIAVAGGCYVVAGLQDGQIAYLEYSPAREEEIEV